jgi:hypothetical protein
MKIKSSYVVVVLFLLSFGLRFFYNDTVVFAPPLIRGDAVDYVNSARNLYKFGVYSKENVIDNRFPSPDSFRPPLLPLVIRLCMSIGKSGQTHWYGYVILLQVVLGAMTAPLMYCTATALSFSPWSACIVALLTLLDPCFVTITGYLLPEVYVSFFLVLVFYLFTVLKEKSRMTTMVMMGTAGALLYFSREEYLFVPLIIGAFYFHKWPKGCSVILVVFLLLPTVWTLRKADMPESPSRLRIAAYEGSLPFPDNIKAPMRYLVARLPQYRQFHSMKDGWAEFFRIMVQRIKKSPELLLWYCPIKSFYLLQFRFLQGIDIYIYPVLKSVWEQPFFIFLKTMSMVVYYLAIPMCILGIYRCFCGESSHLKGIAWVTIFYFAFFHIFVPLPKYMIPFRPIIYLFAVMYLSCIVTEVHEKRLRVRNKNGMLVFSNCSTA